jgi:hypothetical protein
MKHRESQVLVVSYVIIILALLNQYPGIHQVPPNYMFTIFGSGSVAPFAVAGIS